ncbi:MAG: transketolase C-terminal domain-containing protein [Candidatus Babeliales bacterium]
MRATFFNFLVEQAAHDPNLYLIVGDVGFSVAEKFQQHYPSRFINAGIAEQNMIGVAAGLAMAGKNVYVYSIVPFVTMRCFEQIRNDLCYQHLPVKLVGVGGGFSYGTMGATHHAIEDIAIMRALPTMTVVAPGNKYEASQLLLQLNNCTGPVYLRLAASDELVAYPPSITPQLGTACVIIPHNRRYLVTTGNALDLGYQVQQELAQNNISCGLASMHTVKPIDQSFFANKNLDAVFTIEEHSIIGGLGQAVAHHLCENSFRGVFHTFGIPDCYAHECCSRQALNNSFGLTPHQIASIIMRKLQHDHKTSLSSTHLQPA